MTWKSTPRRDTTTSSSKKKSMAEQIVTFPQDLTDDDVRAVLRRTPYTFEQAKEYVLRSHGWSEWDQSCCNVVVSKVNLFLNGIEPYARKMGWKLKTEEEMAAEEPPPEYIVRPHWEKGEEEDGIAFGAWPAWSPKLCCYNCWYGYENREDDPKRPNEPGSTLCNKYPDGIPHEIYFDGEMCPFFKELSEPDYDMWERRLRMYYKGEILGAMVDGVARDRLTALALRKAESEGSGEE